MESFEYIAFNSKGLKKKGIINAENSTQAKKLLKKQGLIPSAINHSSRVGSSSEPSKSLLKSLFQPSKRIKLPDLSLCLRQLATLLKSGLPLEDCLKLMTEQSENEQLRQLVASWRVDLREGQSLSQSMRRSNFIVPDNLIATVSVGEETGHLAQVLDRMATELEVSLENRSAIRGAMVYPIVVLVVSAAVLTILLTVAVPKIVTIFSSTNQTLPILTIIVIALSEYLQDYGLFLLMFIVSVIFIRQWRLRDPKRKLAYHNKLIHRPRMGRWPLLSDLSDWCRGLGLLLSSGVPVIVALNVANESVQNLWLRMKLFEVSEQVKQGSSLYYSLKSVDVIPAFMLHMISSGEASSELDAMLLRVGDYYGTRLKGSIDAAIKLIQPIIMLVLGILVALIIAAIFLPIMNISSAIR